MNPCLIPLVTLALAASLGAVDPPPPLQNPGFEEGAVGEAPPGWSFPTAGTGYRAEVTDETAAEGEHSVVLAWAGDGEPGARSFGNVMQSLDAEPYRGQRVRFSAMVRTRGPVYGDRAQLWLRVDREGGTGSFDNMDDRPVTGSAWRRYAIEGVVAEDATTVNVGAFLEGDGVAWIDDVAFEVLGSATAGHEPPRLLTSRGLANLEALTRLLGVVRFFHPSDEATSADWESLALAGVQRVESALGPKELSRLLEELVRPVAPSVRVYPAAGPVPPLPPEVAAPPDGGPERVVAWYHHGVDLSGRPGPYRSERRVFEDGREVNAPQGGERSWPGEPPVPAERVWTGALAGGVAARVPTALYTGPDGTVPRPAPGVAPPAPDKPDSFRPGGGDRTTRLAGVALAWPVFQHFYPYFDVVEVDWEAELRRALRSAAEDADGRAYLDTLNRMGASLRDGHGFADHDELMTAERLPIAWEWVEGRLVIVGRHESAPEELAVGAVVVAVDGVPAEEAVRRMEAQVSGATAAARRWRAVSRLLVDGGPAAVLTVESADGRRRDVMVERTLTGPQIPREPRPEPVAEPAPGVRYLDLTRVSEEEHIEALAELAAAEAVIFDLRGYPRVSTAALLRLIDEPVTSARWHVPVVTRPDREGMEFSSSSWELHPAEPRIRGKVAFLTDARAISYAETYLGIVEHYRLGEIVGAPTAGTNGNVNAFELPGGFQVTWTGMKVLKHDGSRHHGVGILPTVPAERTIAGVRAGRDEVLERALATVATTEVPIRNVREMPSLGSFYRNLYSVASREEAEAKLERLRREGRPITVAEFLGAPLRAIYLTYHRDGEGQATDLVQGLLDSVILSPETYSGPTTYISWAEPTWTSVRAIVLYENGRVGILETDGVHLCVQDGDGTFWWHRWPVEAGVLLER